MGNQKGRQQRFIRLIQMIQIKPEGVPKSTVLSMLKVQEGLSANKAAEYVNELLQGGYVYEDGELLLHTDSKPQEPAADELEDVLKSALGSTTA